MALSGCGREDEPLDFSASSITRGRTPRRSTRADRDSVTGSSAGSHTLYVSHRGRYTNLVRSLEQESALLRDDRSPAEIQAELDVDSTNPDVWFALGKCYWDRYTDVARALECFQRAAQLAPDAMLPHMCVAEALSARGRLPDAQAEYERALELAATAAERERIYDSLSYIVRTLQGRGYDAQWALETLRNAAHQDGAVCTIMAARAENEGRADDALRWIEQGISLAGTNVALKAELADRLSGLRRRYRDHAMIEAKWDTLLADAELSEYDRMLLEIRQVHTYEYESDLPLLCRRAAGMATNMQQRFDALHPLAQHYAYSARDAAALLGVVDQIRRGEQLTSRMARRLYDYLVHVGAADEARMLLYDVRDTVTNDDEYVRLSLELAERGSDLDLHILDEVVTRFPSNSDVLADIARTYREKNWHDYAAEMYATALEYCGDPEQRIRLADRLLDQYLDARDYDGAAELLETHANLLTNRPNSWDEIGKVHLARGATNEAFGMLIEQFAEVPHPRTRWRLAEMLLDTPWPDDSARQQAASLVWSVVQEMPYDLRNTQQADLCNKVAEAYLRLDQPEQALTACRLAFQAGDPPDVFTRVCAHLGDQERVRGFITELMNGGLTQRTFCAAVARTCAELDMPDLAVELQYAAWQQARTPRGRMESAIGALTTAHDALGETRTEELLAAVEREMRAGNEEIWRLWQLGNVYREVDQTERFETLATELIAGSRGQRQLQAIQQLGWWYHRNGDTTGVQRLLRAHFEDRELSLNEAMTAVHAYRILDNKEQQRRILDGVELQLTNAGAIGRYGSSYLHMLANVGDAEHAQNLGMAWLQDPDMSPQAKLNLVQFMQNYGESSEALALVEEAFTSQPGGLNSWQAHQMLNAYARSSDRDGMRRMADHILNQDHVPRWMLRDLTRSLVDLNMEADAVVLCEVLRERWANDPEARAELLRRQARLYLRTDDIESARACADELAQLAPGSAEVQTLQARINEEAENPQAALDGYLDALRVVHDDRRQRRIVREISQLIERNDVDVDVRNVVGVLLAQQRSSQNLMTSASLLMAEGDLQYATQLQQEALAAARVDSQREEILAQWVDMTRRSGDGEVHLEALRNYLPYVDDRGKPNVVNRIAHTMYENGKYEDFVRAADALLADAQTSHGQHWAVRQVQELVARSHLAMGDTRSAWSAALQLKEGAQPNWHDFLEIAREVGREDEALGDLERAARSGDGLLQPREALLLAAQYAESGGREAELRDLAAELVNDQSRLERRQRMELASLLNDMDDYEGAVGILTELADAGPQWERREASERLLRLWKDRGQWDEALAWAEGRPDDAATLALLGEICDARDTPADAVQYYQRALDTVGRRDRWRQRDLRRRIASSAAAAGDEKLLQSAIDSVLDEGRGRTARGHNEAADMYRAAKRYDDAIDHYQRALRLARSDEEEFDVKSDYARCLEQARKYEKAADTYRDLLRSDTIRWQQKIDFHRRMADAYEKAEMPNKALSVKNDLARACESYLRDHAYGNEAMSTRFTLVDTLDETGKQHEAKRVLQRIIDDFKGTSHARRAEKRLAQLGP